MRRFAGRFACVFVFLSAVLAYRTTGIHIDENHYLAYARQVDPFGDVRGSSKPPLFYEFNALLGWIGRALGAFEPVSVVWIHVLLFSLVFVWAVERWAQPKRFWTLALLLLSSPLLLLNTSQLMMELPLFALLLLLMEADRQDDGRGMFGWSSIGFALKPTLFFAQLALLVGRLSMKSWKRPALLLIGGSLSGLALNKIQLALLRPFGKFHYAGLDELWRGNALQERLSWTRGFFEAWVFYLLLPGVALLVTLSRKRLRERNMRWGVGVFIASLPLTHLMQLTMSIEVIRYTYPVMFVGLVAAYRTAHADLHRGVGVAVIATQLFFSSALVRRDPDRYWGWPWEVTTEIFSSGGMKLQGVPVWKTVTEVRLSSQAPCVWLNTQGSEWRNLSTEFLEGVWPGLQWVTEGQEKELKSPRCERAPIALLLDSGAREDLGRCTESCEAWLQATMNRQAQPQVEFCERRTVNYYSDRPGARIRRACVFNEVRP